jgi:hypothetical protein
MPVTTVSAAAHITPGERSTVHVTPRYTQAQNIILNIVAVKTWFEHYKTKGEKFNNGDKEEVALDDIFFDEYVILLVIPRSC